MAAIIVFAIIIIISIGLSLASKRGAIKADMNDLMTASGSFGPFLLFFISVGEIYTIGTMLGSPGSIYAAGANYGIWFMGYILLAYVVGYFLNPITWRLGQLSGASTLADIIGWRYNSKGLELLSAIVLIIFSIPWIQIQFTGLGILFGYLNIGLSFNFAVVVAAILAVAYIAVSGIRGPAWVSILKDFLLITGVVIVGTSAAIHTSGGIGGIFEKVAEIKPEMLICDPKTTPFILSTILFQMLGFYILPTSVQAQFTSKSPHFVRRNTTIMPLYMLMFPFLTIAAYYAVANYPSLAKSDVALLAVAVDTLPNWVIGLIAGGGTLTAILVMAVTSLAVSGMLSKNVLNVIKPGLSTGTMANMTRIFVALFIIICMLITILFPTLLASVIMIAYAGSTQTFIPVIFGYNWKGATKVGVGSGIVVGLVLVCLFKFGFMAVPFGLNFGMCALIANLIVAIIVSLLTKPDSIALRRFEAVIKTSPKNCIKNLH